MINTGIHCNVTLIKGVGDIVTGSIGPFKNLVLNGGLDALALNDFESWVTYCHVGTSDLPVTGAQTALTSPVASTNNVITNTSSVKGLPPYYAQRIKTWRFVAGTFNNDQIAEVAFSNQAANGAAFSRALVSTAFGQTTTSWIRTDEWLDVVYDFRLYPQHVDSEGNPVDGTGTLSLGGNSYTYVIRPSNVTDVAYWDASKTTGSILAVSGVYMSGYTSTSTLGLVTNQPTTPVGNEATTTNSNISKASYVNGTYTNTLTYNLGPDALAATIGAIRFHTGFGAYQMTLDPPLVKGADVLAFKVTLTWGNVDVA